MIFNMTGGGGNPLNFEIVGGTSQPINPKENTIWVNTSTAISEWVFRAEQPTGASGKVWFEVGASSETSFNTLKENEIRVYPISAKQYVSGSWQNVEAKSYLNGEWKEWIPDGALYYKGNEMTAKTGGWSAYAWTPNNNYTNNGFAFEKNEDHMSLGYHPTTQGGRDWAISSNNKIDMSKYNTLRIDAEHSWEECKFGLSSAKPSSYSSVSWVASQTLPQSRGKTTLDVSNCDSSYYVVVWMYSGKAVDTNCDVYNIFAE
jgi:hypothetical protein